MALVDPALSAIVRADGDALVMRVGGRPYGAVGPRTINIPPAGSPADAATGTPLAELTGRYVTASESRKRELRQTYGVRPLAGEPGGADAGSASTPERVDTSADRP